MKLSRPALLTILFAQGIALPSATFADGIRRPLTMQTTVLTLEGAKVALAGAERAAEAAQLKVSVAVVDRAGNLLAFVREDGAMTVSIENAIAKARTAGQLGKPSKLFQDQVDGGRTSLLAVLGVSAMQGGVPLIVDEKVVGGIGSSGAAAEMDENVAKAGAAALANAASGTSQ